MSLCGNKLALRATSTRPNRLRLALREVLRHECVRTSAPFHPWSTSSPRPRPVEFYSLLTEVLEIIRVNPYGHQQPYEKYVGGLSGCFSKRGCFQHRLVYDGRELEPPGARLLDQLNRCRPGVFGNAEEFGAESDSLGSGSSPCRYWPNADRSDRDRVVVPN